MSQEIAHKKNLLIISIDSVGQLMSGAGLRYLSIAETMAENFDVVLAVPNKDYPQVEKFQIVKFDPGDLKILNQDLDKFDFVLVSGIFALRLKNIKRSKAKVIVDLYDPIILENLFYNQKESMNYRVLKHFRSTQLSNYLAQIGDFYICGSERQRDFWLGVLASNGRINPVLFIDSPDFRQLIDVVGFGIPEQPPQIEKTKNPTLPDFGEDAKIVLWGGGVWDWLNPLPVLSVWNDILVQIPKAKLVFLGVRHPNPSVPAHEIVKQLLSEAKRIGQFEKSIFFIDWLSLKDREYLLAQAHVGLTLHEKHIETHFSMRTRVFDYIWAKLPVIISSGDIVSEWVENYGLGKVLYDDDPQKLKDAILSLLNMDKWVFYEKFDHLQKKLVWSEVTKPLKNYCENGTKANDKKYIAPFFAGNFLRMNYNYLVYLLKFGNLGLIKERIWKFKKHD